MKYEHTPLSKDEWDFSKFDHKEFRRVWNELTIRVLEEMKIMGAWMENKNKDVRT